MSICTNATCISNFHVSSKDSHEGTDVRLENSGRYLTLRYLSTSIRPVDAVACCGGASCITSPIFGRVNRRTMGFVWSIAAYDPPMVTRRNGSPPATSFALGGISFEL